MTSPHERLAQLRQEQIALREKMDQVQKEIDARVPLYVLRGFTKRSARNKYGAHRIGIFSTFEKALEMRDKVKREGGKELEIEAVPKTEARFDNNGHSPSVFVVDGPIDECGYISD
jgi:hypothetical protein